MKNKILSTVLAATFLVGCAPDRALRPTTDAVAALAVRPTLALATDALAGKDPQQVVEA